MAVTHSKASSSGPSIERRRKRPRPTKPLEWWLSRRALEGLGAVVRRMPFERLDRIGGALGDLAYATMPRYRRVALRNLHRCFLGWDEARVHAVARASVRHLGTALCEFLWSPRLTPEDLRRLLTFQGLEHVEAAHARGRGAILASGHYGNWEIVPMRLAADGYPMNTIIRDADDSSMNRLILD